MTAALAPATSPERTHYWTEDVDGWFLQVVSVPDAIAPDDTRLYRAYIGRAERRLHKTPWQIDEETAWLEGRKLIGIERERERASWWLRTWRALRASFARWRSP